MKKILTLTALGTVLLAANAQASGFLLREQSPSAMGNAFAGATAGAEDISYSFYNPAGLSRHKGTQISAGATAIIGNGKGRNATATFPTGSEHQAVMDHVVDKAVLPSVFVSQQLSENVTAALSLNSPFGLITDYSDNWAGANHGTLSDVTTYTLTPMLAYKVNPEFSVGGGIVVEYIRATLGSRVGVPGMLTAQSKMKGDTTDVGYVIGGLYEFTPGTRVGVSYRSEIKHKLKGDIEFYQGSVTAINPLAVDQKIGARLTTPALLTMGVYHDINDRWSVMAEAQKTYWSSFDKLDIAGDKGLFSHTHEGWKDVWFYAVGTSYKVNDNWKLKFGLAFDQNPANNLTRTPRVPDSDRIWYSTGVEYKYDENLAFNLGYTYIRGENVQVKLKDPGFAEGRGDLQAKYQADIHLIGLSANYSF